MRKLLIFIVSLSLLFLFGCSSSNTNTSTNNSNTDKTTVETTDNSTVNSNSSDIVGDWEYNGMIDQINYEIKLDLERDNSFSLEVEEKNTTETIDSELQGTYVVNGNILTLSIITIQDQNGYFTNEVVQNEQLDFKFTQNNQTLKIDNASSTIKFLPGELELHRD